MKATATGAKLLVLALGLAAMACDDGGGAVGGGPATSGVKPGQAPDGTSLVVFMGFEGATPEDTGYSVDEGYGLEAAAFTYNDGTGSQTPMAMSTFIATASSDADRGAYVGCTSGSGFATWGAGVGINLRVPAEEGSPLPADLQCHPPAEYPEAACPFDAATAGFTGVGFYAKLNAGVDHDVRAKVVDAQVAEPASGGTCAGGTACNNAFGASLTGLSDTWQYFKFTWAELSQDAYMSMMFPGLDPTQVLGLQFQVTANTTFDFCIDDIAFLTQ